ncbi:MAG: peptide chain release factor N(5)-glutamine methyltransferase [Candidatus Nanopelagicaceae bacterium]
MSGARELLRWAENELHAGSADPALDALILLSEVTGLSRTHLLFRERFEPDEEENFRKWVKQRKNGDPIQYITGRAYFRHLTLAVGPGVLIPRPESESLVSAVNSKISDIEEPLVVDLGAGSGALGLSVASEVPRARVTAVEKESAALSWLYKNATESNAALSIVHNDVRNFDGHKEFDAVIANPPYIPVGEELPREVINFEPREALFGGVAGLEVPLLFIECAIRALKPGGYLAIEHHESHGKAICEALERSFNDVTLHYDLNNRARWSSGVIK